jgi:hypothetical protein
MLMRAAAMMFGKPRRSGASWQFVKAKACEKQDITCQFQGLKPGAFKRYGAK